ncbi:hypothetical protein P153DRAFT_368901 [Dothidotthia symphoricarpi CBS 119687]|uniref:Extracellular membrane protein CFEM domain-containing protein n=1 Tax=Dothidotthia symphoricarpi CBS 119687 TaxID=1392245 RepID=A0A6A6A7U4_9PLEO|nr:uncharacterized protein P153DRAFT_368901 [Dothidotthia symphoricarpi CBS 119687]KAF2126868.1 hypothetical protein P153DRAFT_368901 [Dothidotthia symphoricarpi CBS 119687]
MKSTLLLATLLAVLTAATPTPDLIKRNCLDCNARLITCKRGCDSANTACIRACECKLAAEIYCSGQCRMTCPA